MTISSLNEKTRGPAWFTVFAPSIPLRHEGKR
jgi:hypothetical protein